MCVRIMACVCVCMKIMAYVHMQINGMCVCADPGLCEHMNNGAAVCVCVCVQ